MKTKWFQQFPDFPVLEAGPHKIPLELTPVDQWQSPQKLYFPWQKGVLSLKGKDRIRFLSGMITGDPKTWETGKASRTLFAERKGKIKFDVFVLPFSDEVLLITEPGEESQLHQYLDFFSIQEEIFFEIRSHYLVYALIQEEMEEMKGEGIWELYKDKKSGGFSLLLLSHPEELEKNLLEKNFQPIGFRQFEELRPFYHLVRSGKDFDTTYFPKEASLNDCVSYTKGCFVGQEPIARMENRGKPNRMVKRFRTSKPCQEGDKIISAEKEIGHITTASSLLKEKGYYSFGLIRTSWLSSEEKSPALIEGQEFDVTD